jgi:PqqD family protein of HPr-rel-A system
MKPKVRDDITVVEIDGEAVIYDERSGDLHHLNPTATIVFGLCDGTATVKEFSSDIADAFEAPVGDVERQVRALIRSLRNEGLLENGRADGHVS